MALSQDLVSQFAKLTAKEDKDEGVTLKGTYKKIGDVEYVQIDGSDILTPVTTTVEAETGERVNVLIKDHMATVMSNITSPSARNKSLEDLKDEIDEQGNTIKQMDNTIIQQGNSIIQINDSINQQNVVINQHDTKINQQGDEIVSLNNTVVAQGNQISTMNNTIVAQGNSIDSMNNTIKEHGDNITSINNTVTAQGNTIVSQGNTIKQHGDQIESQGNTIQQLDSTVKTYDSRIETVESTVQTYDSRIETVESDVEVIDSDIKILNSGFVIKDGVLIGLSKIIIDALETGTLQAEYAKIDFANINMAAVTQLFSKSGIIENLVTEESSITGELVGVTIKGDLIEGNTIKADKLVVLGDDGLYYKLNLQGSSIESEQTEYNSLNGSLIAAKSITASKISVTDLVAFGATIGGFQITDTSINSIGKTAINSNVDGIYLDSNGQLSLGSDTNNHIKYFKDENGKYVLDVRLDHLYLGASEQTAQEELSTLVELTAKGITSSYTSSGGFNLIQNSVGYSGIDFWVATNSSLITTHVVPSNTTSKHEFKLNGNTKMTQIYSTIVGKEYSIAFKYKHSGVSSTAKVILKGQSSDITVLSTKNIYDEWNTYMHQSSENDDIMVAYLSYIATTTTPIIEISLDSEGTFEISDLIISEGQNSAWFSYDGELYGEFHKLDKNGLIFSDANNNSFKASSVGIELKDQNGSTTCELNENKVKTRNAEYSESYKLGKLKTMLLDDNNIIEYV